MHEIGNLNRNMRIGDMKISTRAKNVLIRGGCKNVGDVVDLGFRRCSCLRNCGRICADEIYACIRALGYDWPDYMPKAEPDKIHFTLDAQGHKERIYCGCCANELTDIIHIVSIRMVHYCPLCGKRITLED